MNLPADPPESVVQVHRGVTRRQALALMAASTALANSACSPPPHPQAHPWVSMPEARGGALPLYYASTFVRDGYAHGVLVGTQQGRPIKIEGNPGHPASLGAVDVFGQASVLELWDPDRSTTVRQRAARELPMAAPSTWNAFEAAWQARAERRLSAGGSLRLLTGPVTSPTERALIAAWLAREPGARWHVLAPLADAAQAEGARTAFGRGVTAVNHLDRARCVIAFAADPFSDGPAALRQAADWAAARAAAREAGQPLPALLAAECTPGLFGARADHRIAASPTRLESMLRRIASSWLRGLDVPAPDASTAAFEAHAVTALRSAGAESLVIGGRGLSATSHAIVLALNQALGAPGRTLDWIAPPDQAEQAGTFADLVHDLEGDQVDTLVVLGANPAYHATSSGPALRRAGLLIHAGLQDDETAALADWHLPLSHDYERWGDALALDGSASLQQPAITPLYDTRSPVELLALLSGDLTRDGLALVQRTWRATRSAGFDTFWQKSLRTGRIERSAAAPLSLPRAAHTSAAAAAPSGLVALFVPDPATHDGRFANNGWLQELPHPFTKLTWDNALMLGPKTARRLGVETGDLVRVRVGQASAEAPVWVSAAQAEDVVTLPLGHGRRRVGRVGNDVGFDAFALRPGEAATAAVTLEPLARKHEFAPTQRETVQHERELARTVASGQALQAEPPRAALYPPFDSPAHAWAMTIDLDTCIGCNACAVACQAENNIPVVGKEEVAAGRAMNWIRIDRYELPRGDRSIFQPVPCMHCEEAPCEVVCPVGATVHDSEGLNVQVYNRCIGTRFCSNNCPYKVRRFNFRQYTDEATETLKAQRNPEVTVRQRGVMEKCSYCLQRVAHARQRSEREGVPIADGDVATACQTACPTRAIRFGDLRDPASDIVRAKASPRHYAMLAELGTKPRTTYLARVEPPEEAG